MKKIIFTSCMMVCSCCFSGDTRIIEKGSSTEIKVTETKQRDVKLSSLKRNLEFLTAEIARLNLQRLDILDQIDQADRLGVKESAVSISVK